MNIKNIMNFPLVKFLFVLLLVVFTVGCTHKDDRIVIRFSTWGSASEMKILEPLISEFEHENPTVKVELHHIPQDYFQKLHLLIASNLTPDVVFINNLNLIRYKNYLEDLSGYVDKSDYFKQAIEGMSVDNKLCAVPRDVSTVVAYYNKDLFRKYGVSYPNKEWSMNDMISKSRQLTKNGVWGIGSEHTMYFVIPFMNYFNGGVVSDNGEYIGDSAGSQKGIKLFKDLMYKYHISPTPAERGSLTSAQMFLDGKIAIHLSGRWLVPKYRQCAKFDWDIVNFPHSCAYCDSSGWAVSKDSKHKDIAIRFVLFLASKPSIEKISKDGLIVPARRDVAYSKTFLQGKPQSSELFIYSAESTKPTKTSKDYAKLIDKLSEEVFN